MSNSLPRTMRRNAAMRGSTSSKSNAKVRGLTVPSLSARLLPWLRVTVLSLSSAMTISRVFTLGCRPRGGGDPYSRGGGYGSPQRGPRDASVAGCPSRGRQFEGCTVRAARERPIDWTPMPPATQQRPRRAQSRPRPRRWLSRLAWALALAIMVVVLLPYLLVPLYRTVNPVSTLMLWRWAKGARVERSFVPIERMAPALPMTVIASEDGRFCSHRGIDWRELRERLEDVDDISAARAVSTITQQTAKNLFLWPGRSFVRKAL